MSANNAPQPGPTEREIFNKGTAVYLVAGPRSQTIEDWVQTLAKITGLRMDWRMIGGYGAVLVLGSRKDCLRGQKACADQINALIHMYMTCTYNWTKNPDPRDVTHRPIEIE